MSRRVRLLLAVTACLCVAGCASPAVSKPAGLSAAASAHAFLSSADSLAASPAGWQPASPPAGPHGTLTLSGATAWPRAGDRLQVSGDGGEHWAPLTLPDGVTADSVAAISDIGGRLLVARLDGDRVVEVYRRANSTSAWSKALLTPVWPSSLNVDDCLAPPTIYSGPGQLVTIVATCQFSMTSAIPTLFVSTDGGAHFGPAITPHGDDVDAIWWADTMISPDSGVAVVGPVRQFVLHTADGGQTWQRAAVSGLPAAPGYTLGEPVVDGTRIDVPLTAQTASDGSREAVSMLTSTDGGATFRTAWTLDPGWQFQPVGAITGEFGATRWLVAADTSEILESTDIGTTWTTVHPAGLDAYVTALALTGARSATALVVSNGCTGFKTGCWSASSLMRTDDGGRSWRPLGVLAVSGPD